VTLLYLKILMPFTDFKKFLKELAISDVTYTVLADAEISTCFIYSYI
jgi:hypothetical protein